jgi:hypothetical protein
MKKNEYKKAEDLKVADFEKAPVWEFVNDDELGETVMVPTKKLPVESLAGRLIGTMVQLANGDVVWGLLGNIDPESPKHTEIFIHLSIAKGAKWFHSARYWDFDDSTNGPELLANFLGLKVDDVFPISYDVTKYAKGNASALAGKILKEPKEKLSRTDIIKMAVR